jgi:hypothetical protein
MREDGMYYFFHTVEGMGYSLSFRSEYITAFCGGRFVCDFTYNYPLTLDTTLVRGYEEDRKREAFTSIEHSRYLELRRKLRKFYRAVWLSISEEAVSYYEEGSRSFWIKKGDMRIQLWEVRERPMYWAARAVYGMKQAAKFNNPNSGNDVGMFIGPVDWARTERWKKLVEGKAYRYY